MAKTRALMTKTERDRIAGIEDVEDIKRYQAISRVRRRVEDELTEDVAVLEEHHPDLLEELRDVVCKERENSIAVSDSSTQPVERVSELGVDHNKDTIPPEGLDDALSGVEFPATKDRKECVEAVRAAHEYLQANGKATMSAFVTEVMPGHPVGYDAESDVEKINNPDQRNRSTWWRKVVKPGLKALSGVESPPRGGSDWTYTGKNK
jgi:hypothetical protein